MYIADLHIHSKYSMATSREGDAPHLDLWARKKGIRLVGAGDFTHPAWRGELREALIPAEEGLYVLREDLRLPGPSGSEGNVRFLLTGEISSIYKKNGKTRKVHNLILLPGLDEAERLSARLERIGNIHSDGRPILGLDSRDLLELTKETCPSAVFIPAHIWTPHFSLFGAFSGFDTIEECFSDLTGEIHALETGLSSDPPMNRRVSALDRFTLVSNSDAHSPSKLGREGNLLDTELSYPALKRALDTGEGFSGTLEFFPEEGKYHLDGHRSCGLRLTPEETMAYGGRCPVCGKKITIGVQHRVCQLADRPEGFRLPGDKPFARLVPLPEVIAASLGCPATGKKAAQLYETLLQQLGPEFPILREIPTEDIQRIAGPAVAEGIRRLRAGEVRRTGGYDGEYGEIQLFTEAERDELLGRMALFAVPAGEKPAKAAASKNVPASDPPVPDPEARPVGEARPAEELNPEQRTAVETKEPFLAVIAGPGTGKTKTLVARIAFLMEEMAVPAGEITAVTFTGAAGEELMERLVKRLGKRKVRDLTLGTFHAVCLRLLDQRPLLAEDEAIPLLRDMLRQCQSKADPKETLRRISRVKNGETCEGAGLDEAIYEAYRARCAALGVRDMDDLLLGALALPYSDEKRFTHLLVDEYQDVNAVQRRLVRRWSAGGKSLFVIGDPDQSIYGFRGASAACFDELKRDIPGLATLRLTKNYRSTPEILTAATPVIRQNPGGERALTAARPAGCPVRLVRADGPFSEGVFIAKEIARMAGGVDMLSAGSGEAGREGLRSFSEMAVLTRTRRQLQLIEDCLRHDDIPCLVLGRDASLAEEPVQAALAFFRLALDPGDDAARALCPEALLSQIDEFAPLMQKEKPRKLIERFAALYGSGEAMEKLLDTAVFHGTMEGLLRALAMGAEADLCRASGKRYGSGAVRLMTLHGAKGLEFPVVFLAGLSEGVLPMTSAGGNGDVHEERRLLFVGMTRARDELILTAPDPASPFLGELPQGISRETAPRRARSARQLQLF